MNEWKIFKQGVAPLKQNPQARFNKRVPVLPRSIPFVSLDCPLNDSVTNRVLERVKHLYGVRISGKYGDVRVNAGVLSPGLVNRLIAQENKRVLDQLFPDDES